MTHQRLESVPHHAESSALIPASPERVFALLDDHERLASHMSRSSWRMGGGHMTTSVDEGLGQRVGSHIRMSGRILGIQLALDEVVTLREPPTRKGWETIGSPKLLVIASYRMSFEAASQGIGTLLTVSIDYALPVTWPARWLARLCGRYYADWCTRRMVDDAVREFDAH